MEVTLNIGPREKRTHVVDVSSAGRISWTVSLPSSDSISVGLTWTSASTPEPWCVQPPLRLGPRESHYYTCTTPGSLTFTFDNSSSLLASRAVTLHLSKAPLAAAAAASQSAFLRVGEDTAALNRLGMHGARLYFTNCFAEAEAYFEEERLRVPVYAISYATISWLRAIMTFDAASIAESHHRLHLAQALCEAYMGSAGLLKDAAAGLASLGHSLKSMLGGGAGRTAAASPAGSTSASASASTPLPLPPAAAGSYTPIQLEATLIHGEATLLTALLNLMDESLLSLVKCGLNIRSGWNTYKLVDRAGGAGYSVMAMGGADEPPLRQGMRCTEPDRSLSGRGEEGEGSSSSSTPTPTTSAAAAAAAASTALDVEGGLLFGAGGFNSVASLLPPIVLRILRALDFPNNRGAGLAQLRRCFMGGRIRAPLAGILLVSMGILIPSFHNGGLLHSGAEASTALEALLHSLPNSALPLWLAGRKARMQGRHAAALGFFDRCAAEAGAGLPQLAHLNMYESMWCRGAGFQWDRVLALAEYLQRENAWSKAFYSYVRAVALLELGRMGEGRQAMLTVLTLSSRRIGGKVIPAEQYALKREWGKGGQPRSQ